MGTAGVGHGDRSAEQPPKNYRQNHAPIGLLLLTSILNKATIPKDGQLKVLMTIAINLF
jgi:hypothetical protein